VLYQLSYTRVKTTPTLILPRKRGGILNCRVIFVGIVRSLKISLLTQENLRGYLVN